MEGIRCEGQKDLRARESHTVRRRAGAKVCFQNKCAARRGVLLCVNY